MKKSYTNWVLYAPVLLFMFLYLSMNILFSTITDKHNLPIQKNIKAAKQRLSGKNKKNLAGKVLPPTSQAEKDSVEVSKN